MTESFESTYNRIVAEIESKIASINGKDRFSKLRSYYTSWKLPRHAQSETLNLLCCEILNAQHDTSYDLSATRDLWSITIPEIDQQQVLDRLDYGNHIIHRFLTSTKRIFNQNVGLEYKFRFHAQIFGTNK